VTKLNRTRLGLSLFVLGYGMGPMVLHPISDVPSIGRLPVCT
jgi:DHA1 family multidrug resistance protein-like MFS transporter